MASKTGQEQASAQQIEELLDAVDQTLDRLKTLYEQYFLGIQKQAPAYIHNDVERKLRDLTQMNLRSTRLRYRLATLQQKFGSYNAYWRRTLRQIENGTYARNLAKIGREAAKNGADIPEEILAAMPKRMREQVLRDRDAAIAQAKRRKQIDETVTEDETLPLSDDESDTPVAVKPQRGGAHVLNEADADIDFNAMFAAFEDDQPAGRSTRVNPTRPPINKPIEPPPDASQSQQITQPITRPPTPHAPAPSDTAPTQALPRSAQARPIVPAPGGTQGIPRAVGQQPSAGVPRAVGQQPSGGVPRPAEQAGSGGIPRPVANAPTGGVPRPTPSVPPPAARQTGPVPVVAPTTETGAVPRPNMPPVQRQTPANIPPPGARQTGGVPVVTPPGQTGPVPRPTPPGTPPPTQRQTPVNMPAPPTQRQTPVNMPAPPTQRPTGPVPPLTQPIPRPVAPSQQSRPIPVTPGAAAQTGPVPVESMNGPFPRSDKPAPAQPRPQAPAQPQRSTQSIPKPAQPAAPLKPPPGMTEADVNALHAKYVKAKEMIGEKVDAGSREKLLKTINQTAPKIMEQYKASGVDFSVVVKDNQVVIKAKPKT